MRRYKEYCQFRLLQFNIYFLGKYTNKNLIFHKDLFTQKSFCYQELFDFIKYSHLFSKKLKNTIDTYDLFYPYWKYIISHINDFSFKYFWILFDPYMYPYEQKIIREKLYQVLKFFFQINNKYLNNKKIKILTILGRKIPLNSKICFNF